MSYKRDSKGVLIKCYNCLRECEKLDRKKPSRGAMKEIIIDRIDQLKYYDMVSIDVENIIRKDQKPIPDCVAVEKYYRSKPRNVNSFIYFAKIQRNREDVLRYLPQFSGLHDIDLSERAMPFSDVKEKLVNILTNRKVIGVNLKADLKVLQLEDVVIEENRVDLHDIFVDDNGQPIGLKYLAFALLGKRIQEFSDKDSHNAVIDARMTNDIYRVLDKKKKEPIDGSWNWIRGFCKNEIRSTRTNRASGKSNYGY